MRRDTRQDRTDCPPGTGTDEFQYQIEPERPSPTAQEVPVSRCVRDATLPALNAYRQASSVAGSAGTRSEPRVTPTCFLHDFRQGERVWGLALQLYGLRSERNWGIGDLADLGSIIDFATTWGADFTSLNPLHAPLTAAPERCSPYEPSNRRFLFCGDRRARRSPKPRKTECAS
nr:4-alpha-glucanotransferase [Agrobacterium tumefaciens]